MQNLDFICSSVMENSSAGLVKDLGLAFDLQSHEISRSVTLVSNFFYLGKLNFLFSHKSEEKWRNNLKS